MTYHIRIDDYECLKCKLDYIPFKKDIVCPRCATPALNAEKYFDFVEEVQASMRIHMRRYGNYHPFGWYMGSTAEHIQSIAFKIFTYVDYHKKEDFSTILDQYFEKVDPDGKPLALNIRNILEEIYKTHKRPSWYSRTCHLIKRFVFRF